MPWTHGAISLIEAEDLSTTGATIATVEARYASYLDVLNDDSPFHAATGFGSVSEVQTVRTRRDGCPLRVVDWTPSGGAVTRRRRVQ